MHTRLAPVFGMEDAEKLTEGEFGILDPNVGRTAGLQLYVGRHEASTDRPGSEALRVPPAHDERHICWTGPVNRGDALDPTGSVSFDLPGHELREFLYRICGHV
jgi:hypothetical protein